MVPETWLSRFVERVHVDTIDSPHPITRLPDGRTTLAFRLHDGAQTGDLTVCGPRTRALFKTVAGIARTILIQLKPGWSMQLLGVPARALTDRIVHLRDVWGPAGSDLCDELLAARRVPEILARISSAIASRSLRVTEPASARLARRAVRVLETQDIRIDRVAGQLGVTPRHLRRAFVDSIGIGPKDFARALRLQRAVRGATTASDWGRIAADAGYYDQAHLIVDFRELVGLTPAAFVKREHDRVATPSAGAASCGTPASSIPHGPHAAREVAAHRDGSAAASTL